MENRIYGAFVNRWASRFLISFSIIYIFPFPFSIIGGLYSQVLYVWVPWLGEHVYRLSKPIQAGPNGSGDTTFDYVWLLTMTLLALIVSFLWALDARKTNDRQWQKWLRLFICYYVGMNMLTYGFSKIFHLQMPGPGLYQLVQPFGDKSPMGLAWSYVGFSSGFSVFAGMAEVLGGLLLFVRRTATLGALLTAIVMINVVAMNFFFDIPVKLFSAVLTAMCVFIAWPDLGRLLNVLVFNKTALPRANDLLFQRPAWQITGRVLMTVFVLFLLYTNISSGLTGQRNYGDKRKKSALHGIYQNEQMVVNGDTLVFPQPAENRWKQLIIDHPRTSGYKGLDDKLQYLPVLKIDEQKHELLLGYDQFPKNQVRLHYKLKGDTLLINGNYGPDHLNLIFLRQNLAQYKLINTPFRWINEYPDNQ